MIQGETTMSAEVEYFKIGVVGSAGSGKTSFAEALAKTLAVDFLKSKEITQDILNRDHYDDTSGIQIERFLANSGRQNEILRRTLEQHEVEQFVTDRTVVDLAAYVLCEMNGDPRIVENIINTCKKNVTRYTHLFLCPWRDTPVTDNKKRTLNTWYQFMIHTVERGIMDDWGCKYYIIEPNDVLTRVSDALKILGIAPENA
jgi:predicted ATPase